MYSCNTHVQKAVLQLVMIPAVLMVIVPGPRQLASATLTVQQLDTAVVILAPYVHQVDVYECKIMSHTHLLFLSCVQVFLYNLSM